MEEGARRDAIVGATGNRLRTLTWPPVGESRGRVVLVHGLGEHAGRYGHVARSLAERGLGVLAFDLRGHGESEGERGRLRTFDDLVEDLRVARAHAERSLPGEGAPFLYGHSLGGLVVLRLLQTFRPRTPGVVLSAPWLGTAVPMPAWKRMGVRVLLRLAPDLPLRNRRVTGEVLTRDLGMREAFLGDPLVHHRLSPRFFAEVERAQVLAREQGIDPDVPILVLAPGADRLVDTDATLRWARALEGRRLTLVELEGYRHEPHNDVGREDVLRTVASWISELARP